MATSAAPWMRYRASGAKDEKGPWTQYQPAPDAGSKLPATPAASPEPLVAQPGFIQSLTGYTPSQLLQGGLHNTEQAFVGGGKSLATHLLQLGHIASEVNPLGMYVPIPATTPKQLRPANTAQQVGGGIESALEYLIPTGLEEHIGTAVGEHLPQLLEKVGPLVGRALPEIGSRMTEVAEEHPEAVAKVGESLGKIGHETSKGGVLGGLQAGKAGDEAVNEGLESGLGEMGVESRLANLAGKLHPALEGLGRIGAQALTTGGISKLQGGSFQTGALAGAIGGGLGEVARAAASPLAETALGITSRKTGRGFGRTPGKALLGEIKGLSLERVAENAEQRVDELTGQLENAASSSTEPASLNPAVSIIDSAINKARARNVQTSVDKLQKLRDQLTTDISTGNPLGDIVSPRKILDLKRGVGELVNNWPREEQKGIEPVKQAVYGALDKELDRTVPGADALNQRISSLLPVIRRAGMKADEPGMLARQALRFGARTGALTAGAIGAEEGYRHGGWEGGLIGGTLGLLGPEVLADPEAQIMAARMLNSPLAQRIGKAGVLGYINSTKQQQQGSQ
jgi:hypothetical protein